jgi:hypothetical protein
LAQINPFRHKKGNKNPLRSEAKPEGEKEKKMQIQNQVAKTKKHNITYEKIGHK